jgi:hypothetical protein
VVVGAVECEVLNGLGGPNFVVLDEVDEVAVRREIGPGEFDHPWGDGCREQQILSFGGPVLANILKYLLDVFLETLFQHLICLVKASYLQMG